MRFGTVTNGETIAMGDSMNLDPRNVETLPTQHDGRVGFLRYRTQKEVSSTLFTIFASEISVVPLGALSRANSSRSL